MNLSHRSAVLCAAAVTAACMGARPDTRSDVTGRWEGTASLFGARGPLTLDIAPDGDSLRATVTMNVEALYYDRPLANMSYRAPRVHFEFASRDGNNGVFDGVLKADTIVGVTRKSNRELPMRFVRASREIPAPPYARETVRFRAPDGVTLEGTLLVPKTPGPHPAVIFIHGSGPSVRGDLGHTADKFARRGIAAFAYDKRGSGQSGGNAEHATYHTFAADAAAAAAALSRRAGIIDPDRIGVLGSSEGGWVAPIVAAADPRIAFVIGVVAPGTTYAANGIFQNVTRMEAAGASADEIARYESLIARVNSHVRASRARGQAVPDSATTARLQRALDSTTQLAWRRVVDLPRRVPAGRDLDRLRWQMLDFDPLPYWSRVRAPVMIALGANDRNVNSAESVSKIGEDLRAGGNGDYASHVFPRATHDMMVLPDPAGEFHFPAPPPGYPDTLVSWAASKVGIGAGSADMPSPSR